MGVKEVGYAQQQYIIPKNGNPTVVRSVTVNIMGAKNSKTDDPVIRARERTRRAAKDLNEALDKDIDAIKACLKTLSLQ